MRLANVILRRAAASLAFAAVIRSRFSARARASSTEDPIFFNFLRTSLSLFDAASRGEAPATKPWGTVIVSDLPSLVFTLNESPCFKPTGTVTWSWEPVSVSRSFLNSTSYSVRCSRSSIWCSTNSARFA